MAKSLFRRFPADDLIWESPDADESDGGPIFFSDVAGQNAWEIGEDFWELPSGGGYVDLAATLAGSEIIAANLVVARDLIAAMASVATITGALGVDRGLGATVIGAQTVSVALGILRSLAGEVTGSQADLAALGVLRTLAASGTATQSITAGLGRLVGLISGAGGGSGGEAAAQVLRGLVAEIAGISGGDAGIAVARALSAAASATLQIAADLTTGEGQEEPPPPIVEEPAIPILRPFVVSDQGAIYAQWLESLPPLQDPFGRTPSHAEARIHTDQALGEEAQDEEAILAAILALL